MRELLKNTSSLFVRKQSHILTAAVVIMLTFALSHLVGLVKTHLLVSYFFNLPGSPLDVYYAAFVVPDTIFQLLVIGSLSAAFIPVFSRYLAKNESEAWKVASSTLNFILLLFLGVSVVIYLFSSQLADFIAPGFTSEQITLLTGLMRYMLLAQLFFTVSGFLTAMLQSHQRFLVPALAPILYNLGIIIGIIFLSPSLGIYGPGVGAVIGAVLHMSIQLPLAYKLGFRPSFKLNLRLPGLKEIVKLMPPRAVSLGVDQIEQLVAVTLASTLAGNSLAVLNIARLLYMIPASLFGVTIGQAAFPALTRQSAEGDHKKFIDTFISALHQVVFLALPISVLFIVLRIPVVRLVFGAKSFPWEATVLTGWTLAILTLAATFAAAQQLINRGFYSLHDTKTPLYTGLVAAILGSLGGLVATQYLDLGVKGLAAVIAISGVIETSVLLMLISKRLKINSSRLLPPLVKMFITALVTGISLYLPMKLLDNFVFDTTRTIPLIALTTITTTIGMGVYLLLSFFFGVGELFTFLNLLKRLKNFRSFLKSPHSTPVTVTPPDQS